MLRAARLIKVLQVQYNDDGEVLAILLTDAGTIVKLYPYDEAFFKEFERKIITYKKEEEFI